jgi:hypothetical protein
MDREDAQKALELLRSVVSQARDDTALQNWGVIWVIHAFTNSAAFIGTNILLWHKMESRYLYAALWGALVVINIGVIFVLKSRRSGAKTFIENQIWAIWLTFIVAVILVAVVNDLLGMPLFGLGPVIAILSAVGFSSMGAVMGRRWFIGTAVFSLSALAMALAPQWQFILLGGVWGVAQLAGGIWLISDKKKRLAAVAEPPRLV